MQITTGIRSILSNPLVYSTLQNLMGAKQGYLNFVRYQIRPFEGVNILDIGCGPGDIVDYLPSVNYWGFDISETYISQAKKKYGNIAKFECKYLTIEDLKLLPKFDVVIASGVLHHMDDDTLINFFKLAVQALKDGGRLVTIDPCYTLDQNFIARFLISKDRGQNVRDEISYKIFASQTFKNVKVDVKHKLWIPYTHCYMECTK